MRRTRQAALKTRHALVRPILAAALLFCVMSGALPAEADLNPYDSMPCCRGMKGMAGECHGNSCPMHRRARSKRPKRVQRDPVCGARYALQALVRKTLTASPARLQDAHLHDQAPAGVEHNHGGSVSPYNNPRTPPAEASVEGASLTKPCPSNCCGTATGFTGLRRPRHEAALTDGPRPRQPTTETHRYAPYDLIKVASALRRSHPPRAPPSGLRSRAA